jgi:hypothetical protein
MNLIYIITLVVRILDDIKLIHNQNDKIYNRVHKIILKNIKNSNKLLILFFCFLNRNYFKIFSIFYCIFCLIQYWQFYPKLK